MTRRIEHTQSDKMDRRKPQHTIPGIARSCRPSNGHLPLPLLTIRSRATSVSGVLCLFTFGALGSLTFLTFFAGFSTPPFAALALVGDLSAFLGAMVKDIEFQKE